MPETRRESGPFNCIWDESMRKYTSCRPRQTALLLLACAPLLGQPAAPQPELVIRSNVHVVEVSIVATDAVDEGGSATVSLKRISSADMTDTLIKEGL
jgi:hypothetical protein